MTTTLDRLSASAGSKFARGMVLLLAGFSLLLFFSAQTPADAQTRVDRSYKVGTTSRKYAVYLPAGVASKTDLRVMIVYHPALNTAQYMIDQTKIHTMPGAENFIVVYPEGYQKTWNAGVCCGAAAKAKIDEVAFFNAIMKDVGTMAKIRPKAYVTGFSNGALMVYQLMCKIPGQLAAAAPFASYLPSTNMQNCAAGVVPLMHMHGDADPGFPVDGGNTTYLGFVPPARDTVKIVAKRNACGTNTYYKTVVEIGSDCLVYEGPTSCDTRLCVIPDLGHVWPGSKSQGATWGPARPDLSGSKAVINFFMEH